MTKQRNKKLKAGKSAQSRVQPTGVRRWLAGWAMVGLVAVGSAAFLPETRAADVVVYKNPNCGCCGKWVKHLQSAGYSVEVHNRSDLGGVKKAQGVPASMGSCHTAVADGYFIEGHVPATDIDRLLAERPAIKGLVVPGMPLGSPGMEVPGRKPMKYTVYAVDQQGRTSPYASH